MNDDILKHYGILGMKWGIRRYQNEDGTLTSAGKNRRRADTRNSTEQSDSHEKAKKAVKAAAIGTAVVAGTVLTAYLVKKYGGKSMGDLSEAADAGKTALEKVMEKSVTASTPVSELPVAKVEPKKIIEETVKKISSEAAKPQATATTPKVQAAVSNAVKNTPVKTFDYSQPYSFETLMRQNQDLLEKMYRDLK